MLVDHPFEVAATEGLAVLSMVTSSNLSYLAQELSSVSDSLLDMTLIG